MTTNPVMTITDEMIAELEFQSREIGKRGGAVLMSKEWLDALLQERASLLADAGRYRWLLENADLMHWENMLRFSDLEGVESINQFIDSAINKAPFEGFFFACDFMLTHARKMVLCGKPTKEVAL